jgi:hypothetical protein
VTNAIRNPTIDITMPHRRIRNQYDLIIELFAPASNQGFVNL